MRSSVMLRWSSVQNTLQFNLSPCHVAVSANGTEVTEGRGQMEKLILLWTLRGGGGLGWEERWRVGGWGGALVGAASLLMEDRKKSAASVGWRLLWCTVAQILNSVRIRR